jgi:hypothetical protein
MGVNKNVGAKATDDYENRSAELGAAAGDLIFVFVTPRRWANADGWARARASEGVFKDVRALDADDLEGWLTSVPAVHHWISEHLGRHPKDAETLDTWWEKFAARTTPQLAPELFTAGRSAQADAVRGFIESGEGRLTVAAPWREDVLAFLAASSDSGRTALVVRSRDAWDRLLLSSPPSLLVADFEDPPLEEALRRGHQVIVVAAGERVAEKPKIQLARIGRSEAADALRAVGLDYDRAYRLAGLGRRSMPALIRRLARDPMRLRPPWARPPDADVLAPLALVGGWTASAEDRAAVADFVGRTWDETERLLRRWSRTDDPPFIESAREWHLASAEETVGVLLPAVTTADLDRWHELIQRVVLTVDPRLALPRDERRLARLRDGMPEAPSDVLRSALSDSAALLGVMGDEDLADGRTAEEHARLVVKAVLGAANEDSTALLWRSLSPLLPRLAEASPSEFLSAISDDIDSTPSSLAQMFEDGGDFSAMWGSSSHTGLLLALEVLCWSPEWLLEASRALAALCVIDPGGRLSNRPLESLRNVLIGWIRHTSAPREHVLEVISALCREFPDVGWRLLMGLWPETHGVAFPPSSPRFRDWAPDSRTVTVAQMQQHVSLLVEEAIELSRSLRTTNCSCSRQGVTRWPGTSVSRPRAGR